MCVINNNNTSCCKPIWATVGKYTVYVTYWTDKNDDDDDVI